VFLNHFLRSTILRNKNVNGTGIDFKKNFAGSPMADFLSQLLWPAEKGC
jgi:hypothetical protein